MLFWTLSVFYLYLYGCLITLASCETKNATEDNTKWGEEKLLFSKKCNRNPMQVQWNLSTPNIRRTSFCVQIRQIQVKVTHISYIWTLLKFDFIQGSGFFRVCFFFFFFFFFFFVIVSKFIQSTQYFCVCACAE